MSTRIREWFQNRLCCNVLQCVAANVSGCCSVFQRVLQRVAACCSMLQCVAVCCSVLQCVAMIRGWFQKKTYKKIQTKSSYGSSPPWKAKLEKSREREIHTHLVFVAYVIVRLWLICFFVRWNCTRTLQYTATHCNTLQHTATHCNTNCNTNCNTLLLRVYDLWICRQVKLRADIGAFVGLASLMSRYLCMHIRAYACVW